jgi:AcrR family transcriptional regulator
MAEASSIQGLAQQPDPDSLEPRYERRKARTRAALISAAQGILADGARTEVSIAEITAAADVGLGSFYNYFQTKEELFEEAIQEVLNNQRSLNEKLTSQISDPAERYAVGLRLTGRLVLTYPRIVKLILNTGLSYVRTDQGLAEHALLTLEESVLAGQFKCDNPNLAQSIVGGALLGLLQCLDQDPEIQVETAVDNLAISMLKFLGMSASDAAEIVNRPLPGFTAH